MVFRDFYNFAATTKQQFRFFFRKTTTKQALYLQQVGQK